METSTDTRCKSCSALLHGEFCSQCGQKLISERLTLRSIFRMFMTQLTNVEKGLFYTIMMLFRAPETVIQNYLAGATNKYYNPFRFILILTTVSTLLLVLSGGFDNNTTELQNYLPGGTTPNQQAFQQKAQALSRKYTSFFLLAMVPFAAFCARIFWRKRTYNYAEHLTAIAFIVGQLSLMGLILLPLYILSPTSIPFSLGISFMLGVGYYAYVYKRWFNVKWPKALLAGFWVHFGSFLLFFIIIFILVTVSVFIYTLLFKKA